MQKRIVIKNHQQEIHLINQRCIVALVVMLILVFLLILRLGYLQLIKHDMYTTLSQKNWLELAPLEPTRGLIYDRNGVLLAENIPVFSLDVLPYKIKNIPKMLEQINKIIPLNKVDIAQFQKQLKQHRRFDEIPLKLRLTEIDVAKFSENQYKFPGVIIKARLIRHYPLGESFSHVLGYVGRINTQELDDIDTANYSATNYIGKLGIEKYYEEELHGTVGYEQAENDASGESIRTLNQINPIPGKNLHLTIDSKLQLAIEKAMDGYNGAVIAIQPATGQVLAMVSEPSYDPNLFVAGISTQDFKALQESPDHPLYNRALRSLYPIASTIKPYLALEGLESGVADPNFILFDPGWFQLKNSSHIFYDMKRHGHGMVNLNKAIICSCDTYFYDLASKLGIQRIDEILTRFGFGELTGIDIGEELNGTVASPAWKRRTKGIMWYPGDTVNSGIGQGFMQATPLQLAVAVSTLANRGARFTPYLLLQSQQPGKAIENQLPQPLNKIMLKDKNNWKFVINAMESVVSSPEGTAHTFGNDMAYTVAAKTGTAQLHKQKRNARGESEQDVNMADTLRDHHLFIAFAPVDHPQIAIAMVVENNHVAIGIAREILDAYLEGDQHGSH